MSCGIAITNKTPILYGLVGFLGFDYILSQMFYGIEVNVCGVKGGYEWKLRDKAHWVNKKEKNNKNKMYIFLFIANRDGLLFGEGAGTINHNRVNCWPPTTRSPMWNFILHCSTRYDCHEETPRSAFIQFIAKKGYQSRYTLYRPKQRQHPVSKLAAEINTIVNVVFTLPYFNLPILYLWNC